ncbi:MAG: protein kinase [Propionibacteriaceae bacterium]|nr:protein kinase [Propionibacteriaceae bacterium]
MPRAPQPPPKVPGATYKAHLGSGGFADVFLYEQRVPRRDVAVKVLAASASPVSREAFEAEANLMARLSSHPSVLSVYGAGTAETGQPFLIMEYCPPPNMGKRVRQAPLSVQRALQVGIQLAGAVESLHRVGIIHRDIKPANVLVTAYNHPVLTDFGIAVSRDDAQRAEGFSPGWAAPEQQTESEVPGPQADVFSLAATIYTFLTGRAPFEIVGGDNTPLAMSDRVLRMPLPKTGREDVPPQLERVFAVAMAKRPEQRYPSALDFARALQDVQTDLRQQMTVIDLLEEPRAEEPADDDGDHTRMRAPVTIDPEAMPTGAGPTREVGSGPGSGANTSLIEGVPVVASDATRGAPRREVRPIPARSSWEVTGRTPAVEMDATLLKQEQASPVAEAPAPPRPERTRRGGVIAVVAVLAVALLGGFVWWTLNRDEGRAQPNPAQPTHPPAPAPSFSKVPEVTGLSGSYEGDQAVFTWEYQDENAEYVIQAYDPEGQGKQPAQSTRKKTVTLPRTEGKQLCLSVKVKVGATTTPGVSKCLT